MNFNALNLKLITMKYFILIGFLLASFFLTAQVGIDTNNPDQKLDINGKVKIGDDAAIPTPGTMRYNMTIDQFQGYNGTEWLSFSQQANGPLPSESIPVFSFENIIPAGNSEQVVFRDWDETIYNTIPVNKMIIVTGIYPCPNAASLSNDFYALSLNVYNSSTSSPVTGTTLRISGYDNVSQFFSGDQSPLFVVKSGQYLSAFSYGSSELTMALSVRGFLVDDLSY